MARQIRSRSALRQHGDPGAPKIQKVELSNKHLALRIAAAAAFLLIGAAALAYAFQGFFSPGEDWTQISANSSEINCSADFTLLYRLGASGNSASADNRELTSLYTDAAVKAYRLFNTEEHFEDIVNVFDINKAPNSVLTVDPVLYEAFSILKQLGSRALYLGPIYDRYENLFFSQDDSQTIYFDPYQDDTIRAEFQEIAAFAGDRDAVDLELLGENQVCLRVSEKYMTYAKENEISHFIDFFWMKNAFIADYFADLLIEHGYTYGSISSFDGFSRNLDSESGTVYGYTLFDRIDSVIYPAAEMAYQNVRSIVCLRDYPINTEDSAFWYAFQNQDVRAPYVDPTDGLPKAALKNLVAYSDSSSCAEIALKLLPIYAADQFDPAALKELAAEEIHSVWFDKTTLLHSESGLTLNHLYENDTVRFTAEKAFD